MAHGLPYSLGRAVTNRTGPGKYILPIDAIVDVDATGGTVVGFGAASIMKFPLDVNTVSIQHSQFNLSFTTLDGNMIAVWDGDFSVGTVATADATLDGDEINVVPQVVLGPAVDGVAQSTAVGIAPLVLPGSPELFLNMLVDEASITDSTTAQVRVRGSGQLVMSML